MKNLDIMFSNEDNSWATPQDIFDKLNDEFHFTLDPCASKHTAKCKKFYTKEDDGLSKCWKGETVFCNPPYGSEIKEWVKYCHDESEEHKMIVVMLIPARTDTKYFHKYIYKKSEIRFLEGRLKFGKTVTQYCKNKKGFIILKRKNHKFINLIPKPKIVTKDAAPFPSMVVIFKG